MRKKLRLKIKPFIEKARDKIGRNLADSDGFKEIIAEHFEKYGAIKFAKIFDYFLSEFIEYTVLNNICFIMKDIIVWDYCAEERTSEMMLKIQSMRSATNQLIALNPHLNPATFMDKEDVEYAWDRAKAFVDYELVFFDTGIDSVGNLTEGDLPTSFPWQLEDILDNRFFPEKTLILLKKNENGPFVCSNKIEQRALVRQQVLTCFGRGMQFRMLDESDSDERLLNIANLLRAINGLADNEIRVTLKEIFSVFDNEIPWKQPEFPWHLNSREKINVSKERERQILNLFEQFVNAQTELRLCFF